MKFNILRIFPNPVMKV